MARKLLAGVTLLEILIAVAVLAVGILTLLSALGMSLRSSSHGARVSEATGYARTLVSLIRANNLPVTNPINDPPSARVPLANALGSVPSNLPSNTGMTRNITMREMKTATTGAPDDYLVNLYQVDVTVFWQDPGGERNVALHALHQLP